MNNTIIDMVNKLDTNLSLYIPYKHCIHVYFMNMLSHIDFVVLYNIYQDSFCHGKCNKNYYVTLNNKHMSMCITHGT